MCVTFSSKGVRFGRPPMPKPPAFEMFRREWVNNEISAREAARCLGIDHKTFITWANQAAELDAFVHTAIDEPETAEYGNSEENEHAALTAEHAAIAVDAYEIAEEVAVLLAGGEIQVAHGGVPGIAQGSGEQKGWKLVELRVERKVEPRRSGR